MCWNNSSDKLICFGIGQRREEHPGGCFESSDIWNASLAIGRIQTPSPIQQKNIKQERLLDYKEMYNSHLHHFDRFHFLIPLWPGLVSVSRVLDHVEPGELCLPVVVELLLLPRHRLPPGAQDLGDVRVVEIRTRVQNLPPLVLGPDHEGVHWSLDVIFLVLLSILRSHWLDNFVLLYEGFSFSYTRS